VWLSNKYFVEVEKPRAAAAAGHLLIARYYYCHRTRTQMCLRINASRLTGCAWATLARYDVTAERTDVDDSFMS